MRKRFLGLGILILIVVGAIFYLLFFWRTLWVEKIIVSGQEKVAKEEIELLVENRLENRVLFFKTKSIFIVDVGQIKRDILNNFPAIAGVEVNRGFFDAIKVVVVERIPLASWCPSAQCFLIDGEGVAFEKAPPETESLRIEDDQISEEPALGEVVINKTVLVQIFDIRTKLAELAKISIEKAALVSEGRLNVETSEGWEIYFNLNADIDWQARELAAVLEKQISPEKRGKLDYIDLRFSEINRVYYK